MTRPIGLVGAAFVMTIVSLLLTRADFARITVNAVDTLAVVTDDGRHLVVTGPIHAPARGAERFQEGPATAVEFARTASGASTTDAHQWLVRLTQIDED